MKKLTVSTLLALSTTLAMVSIAPANAMHHAEQGSTHESSMKGEKHHGWGMQKVFEQLNLSETQKSQMKALKDAQRAERKSQREAKKAQWQQKKAQMQALINQPILDTVALNNLANQKAENAKERFIKRAKNRHAIAQILTVEQREKMQQIKAERKQNRRGGKGKRYNR